jgi:hypothetical protein
MEHVVSGLIGALALFGLCTAAAVIQSIGFVTPDALWWPLWVAAGDTQVEFEIPPREPPIAEN